MKAKTKLVFPANVLNPVGRFLQQRLKLLEKRKKVIEKDDPFKDPERLLDNASPDTEAAEQFGHARTSALKTELTRKIIQTRKALTRIKIGKYGLCEDCGQMIDTDRLVIYPEATKCIKCEAKREK
jgi:RNA polymerase-binding transcription factor DksA